MKKAVVIKTGDTFPKISSELGDFEDWIITGLGIDPSTISVRDVAKGQGLPDPESISGAVIAGSYAMVTQDLDWSLSIERWLPELVDRSIPVLGICYGHQLLARAMGGTVGFHPGGMEIGTRQIVCKGNLSSDPLFTGLPDRFRAHVSHSQTVVELPEKSLHIAGNDFEPHHAFRIGTCAWGIQFHPEYDQAIMRAYANAIAKDIESSGLRLNDVLATIEPTPVAEKILQRFGRLITNKMVIG